MKPLTLGTLRSCTPTIFHPVANYMHVDSSWPLSDLQGCPVATSESAAISAGQAWASRRPGPGETTDTSFPDQEGEGVVGYFRSCAHNVGLVELRLPLFLPSGVAPAATPTGQEENDSDQATQAVESKPVELEAPPRLLCCPPGHSSPLEVIPYLPEWWQQQQVLL